MDALAPKNDAPEATSAAYSLRDAIAAAEADMSFFGGICMPEICTVQFPPIFVGMWKLVTAALSKERDFSKFALGLPRGHGKTTVLKLLIAFIVLFTQKKFILIICANATLAENIISDVCDILDSPNIVKLFGNWRDACTVDRQEQKRFTFRGRSLVLAGLGSGGSPRGLNIKNRRPDVIICDDMQTKDEAESEAVSKKLLSWFVGTLMKAKAPDGCTFLYVGNMYRDIKIGGSQSSLYTCILRNLQSSPNWISWIVGAILADGSALWEEVQPLQQLLEELQQDTLLGQAEVFFSEVLNDPKCGNTELFDLSKLPAFDIVPEVDIAVGSFLVIDPSLGKKTSDAQIVNHVIVYDGIPCIEHIHVKQVPAPVLVDWCIEYALKHKIPLICPEAVAYQSTLGQWFERRLQDLSLQGSFEVLPVSPKGRKKNSRILQFLKNTMGGKIKINPRCLASILSQIASFNPLSTQNVDDILDTCAYTDDVVLEYPQQLIYKDILSLENGSGYEVVEDNCVFGGYE